MTTLISGRQALAVVLVALAAYGGTLDNGPTYDDRMVLWDAAPFLSNGPWRALVTGDYFSRTREGTYRPVVTLSYIADFQLWGRHLRGFHAQSITWHVLASLLVAALAAHLLGPSRRRVAVVAGLFFACHPLTSEAVENVSFREDLLATAFTLLAVLLALRRSLALSLAAYAVALFAKESAVVMPLLLAVCRVAVPGEHRARREITQEVLAFIITTAVWLVIRFGPMAGPANYAAFAGGTRAATLWVMPQVLAHYLRLVVAPWPLLADYSGYFSFGQPSAAWLATLPLAGFAFWQASRRDRLAALGLAWFLLALAPVANVFPTPILAAERFLYLPLVGAAMVATALAARLEVRRAAWVAGGAVLAGFVVLTNARHAAWRDNLALWTDVATTNPASYRAHANVAIEVRANDPVRATAEFEQSLRLCHWVPGKDDVDNVLCSSNAYQLGRLRLSVGDLDGAEAAYQLSLRIRAVNHDPVLGLEEIARARQAAK